MSKRERRLSRDFWMMMMMMMMTMTMEEKTPSKPTTMTSWPIFDSSKRRENKRPSRDESIAKKRRKQQKRKRTTTTLTTTLMTTTRQERRRGRQCKRNYPGWKDARLRNITSRTRASRTTPNVGSRRRLKVFTTREEGNTITSDGRGKTRS